jgi:signal transduction histidine kinase
MIDSFKARHRWQQALICLVGAGPITLVILEAATARYLPVTAATTVSGLLCLAALFAPRHRFSQLVTVSAAASFLVTATEMWLAATQRSEFTYSLMEQAALLLLIVRSVRRVPPLKATVLAAPVAIAATALPLRLSPVDGSIVDSLVYFVIVCAVPSAVMAGLALRLRDRLRAQEREAIRQTQRLEHAQELHDFVAHHVTAIVAQTKAARFTAEAGQPLTPEQLDRTLDRIEQAGTHALTSMRAMVSALRSIAAPTAADRTGDLGAVRDLVEEFSVPGPPVALTLDPELTKYPLAPQIATTIYRVVRESLTNARKHAASATQIAVTITPAWAGHFEVSVTDDGHEEPGQQNNVGGFGLVGLTERVEEIGGRLSFGTHETGGWQVRAVLPRDAADHKSCLEL